MTRSRRPWLLRLGRACFLLGTVLLLSLIAYVGSATYYATRVSAPGGGSTSLSVEAPNSVVLAEEFNLSNPGPFPIERLRAEAVLYLPNDSVPHLARTTPVTVAGGSLLPVRLALTIPFTANAATASLLTQDSALPYAVWINATYASVVDVALSSISTYAWGAPFANLSVSPGAPSVHPNGTVAWPVVVGFEDHASFAVVGTLTVNLRDASGRGCAAVTLPIAVDPHQAYDHTATVWVPPGCSPAGGSYALTWSGSGLSVELPGGRIP